MRFFHNKKNDCIQCDAKFVQSVKYMRGFRSQFDNAMSRLLDQFQQVEYERLKVSRNCIKHFLDIEQGK